MNIEEALELFHKLTSGKGVDGTLEIKRYNSIDLLNFAYHIHADKKAVSDCMAIFVKETGIELKKERLNNWQVAAGSKGNVRANFYPRGGTFPKCTIKSIVRKVWVPPKTGHYEDKISYEVVCKNGEKAKK